MARLATVFTAAFVARGLRTAVFAAFVVAAFVARGLRTAGAFAALAVAALVARGLRTAGAFAAFAVAAFVARGLAVFLASVFTAFFTAVFFAVAAFAARGFAGALRGFFSVVEVVALARAMCVYSKTQDTVPEAQQKRNVNDVSMARFTLRYGRFALQEPPTLSWCIGIYSRGY